MRALTRRSVAALAAALLLLAHPALAGPDPLPSWNERAAKQAIVAFVRKVTEPGPGFAPPAERIATFGNDGTLWAEQPIYAQFAFTIDRARAMAEKDPALKAQPAFAAAASGDPKAIAALGEKLGLVAATHSGLTAEAFAEVARNWFAGARHSQYARPF
jgi:hypothetical protein